LKKHDASGRSLSALFAHVIAADGTLKN